MNRRYKAKCTRGSVHSMSNVNSTVLEKASDYVLIRVEIIWWKCSAEFVRGGFNIAPIKFLTERARAYLRL